MDLKQRKLNRSEWDSIEIPVPKAEIDILNMIVQGYHDVNIRINNNNSIFSYLKIEFSEKIEDYIYNRYLRKRADAIENKLLERKKEGEQASYTAHQFMSQLLKEIETETGSVVNCYLQSDPQSSGVKIYTIVNRHNDIKGSKGAGYTFKTLTPNSIIKGISMSSNLDAEMSAIAYTGGSGKYPNNAIKKVFNCSASIAL